jgi:hypothetical protein
MSVLKFRPFFSSAYFFGCVVIALQVTEKGLAKAGIRKTEIPTKPEPSKNHFRFFKITKNKKTKWFFAAKSAEIF